MDSFESKVLSTIEKHSLLDKGDTVVAAVSGGPDSVSLLVVLNQLAEFLQLTLLAGHANHQLRGDESEEDQRFVGDLCKRLNVPLESLTIELGDRISGGNLEDLARQRRYQFLAELVHREKAVLATGHNLNDQAETFLMKLFRGAGPSGLSGILVKRSHQLTSESVSVVRPLIEVTREEILGYLRRKNQPFREDSTNADVSYDRNWVRHHLLPTLQDRFNPGIKETLSRNATLFAEIEQHLEKEAEELMGRIGSETEGEVLVDLSELNRTSPALAKQLIRQAIHSVKGDLLDISQNHIMAVLNLCGGTSGRQTHLPGGVRVGREFDSLRIHKTTREAVSFEHRLRLPGRLYLPEIGKTVIVRKVSVGAKRANGLLSTRIDCVTVRNRRPGDRFMDSGKSSEIGLKKLFLKERVPISMRDRLVMLESEGKVVWIEGFPVNPQVEKGELEQEGFEIEVVSETFGPSRPSK
jgi:tRNA(Ile)-lysidine synthase